MQSYKVEVHVRDEQLATEMAMDYLERSPFVDSLGRQATWTKVSDKTIELYYSETERYLFEFAGGRHTRNGVEVIFKEKI